MIYIQLVCFIDYEYMIILFFNFFKKVYELNKNREKLRKSYEVLINLYIYMYS